MKIFNITDDCVENICCYGIMPSQYYDYILHDKCNNKNYFILETGSTLSNVRSTSAGLTVVTKDKLRIAAVHFANSSKLYHYFVRESENIKIGDTVEIDAVRGRAKVRIVMLTEAKTNAYTKATKLLPLIKNDIPKTPQVTRSRYYNFEVKFIDDRKGLSKPYYYSSIEHELPNELKAQVYNRVVKYVYLKENTELVCVQCESITNTPQYGLKTFRVIESEDADLIHKKLLKHETEDIEMAYKAFLSRGLYKHSYDKELFLKVIEKMIKERQLGQKITEEYNKEKENKIMNMNVNKMFGNIEFGKINTNAIKYSIAGLAFRGADGSYLTYDLDKMEAINVGDMVFDFDCVFAMPVAAKDIQVGDVIKHQGKFMIVKGDYEDGTIAAIDPVASTETSLIPVKNIFGFNYVTKIVNMFEGMAPNGDNPFGDMNKMLPMMMLMDNNRDNDMFSMFTMMSMFNNNSNEQSNLMSNPLFMYAMMKGDM